MLFRLKQNEYHATNQSLAYQQYNQQITQTEQLIDTDRMFAQSDLAHNYRSNADRLLTIEIPKLEKNIANLQQHKAKLSNNISNPTTLAIMILPTKHAEIILLITLALLIDLISAFLISLCFSKQKLNKAENVSENISGAEEDINKVVENNNDIPETKHTSEKKASSLKSIADDLLIRVRENIKNQVYEPKVTKVMAFEQIGYSKAKEVLTLI